MKSYKFLCLALVFFIFSCSEDKLGPLKINNNIPKEISDIDVENVPGGARISYNIPKDNSISYVEVEYNLSGGQTKSIISSIYANEVIIKGFSDTLEHIVKLYTVTSSEKKSKPVEAKIKPLKAPIFDVFPTLDAQVNFGGIDVHFSNNYLRNEYVIHVIVKNSNQWNTLDRLYTSSEAREFPIRGLDNEKTDFGFFIMDEWQNRTDTIFKTLEPLLEESLNKSLWKDANLDNDINQSLTSGTVLTKLWDDNAATMFRVDPDVPGLDFPMWQTIDLGQKAILSRIKVYLKSGDDWIYSKGEVKEFELWGSNDPSPDGDWKDWELLGSYEMTKPSGRPPGDNTAEDIAFAAEGQSFSIPVNGKAYKYIRLNTLSTWTNRLDATWGEIYLYGQIM